MTREQAMQEDGSSQPEFDVLAASIGAAIRQFIGRLDTCRRLMDQAARIPGPAQRDPLEVQAAKRLTSVKRRAIDKEVQAVLDDFPALTAEALNRLIAENTESLPDPPIDTEPYPLSPEQAGAMMLFFGERGMSREIESRFTQFGGDEASRIYINARLRAGAQESVIDVQGGAILPVVVSAFEQFLGALMRTGLAKHPKGLGEPPAATWEIITRLQDMADVQRYLLDNRVTSFLQDGPSGWRKQIKKWTQIDIACLGIDWDEVTEAIQRRHSIIHNGGAADKEYLERVDRLLVKTVKVGDRLPCTAAYMERVTRSFHVLGIILSLRWARHFGVETPLQVLPELVQYVYDLEREGHWEAAYELANAAMGLADNEPNLDDMLRVNWWLCRRHLGLEEVGMRTDIEEWRPDDLELIAARAALLQDYEGLAGVIAQIRTRRGSSLRNRSLQQMVIFEHAIQESTAVRDAFSGRRKPQPGGPRKRNR